LDFNTIDEFNQTVINSLDFTKRSEDAFFDAVDLATFHDKDAETIFQHLISKIRLILFGDYLKRYIYLKAGMSGNYDDIAVREYQHIIIDSFDENNTPKSFAETSAKISALSKNWLTQASVNRSIVFLLGFGLNMSVEDVTEFLTKALREQDFNFKDPTEIIYWYCYKNSYKYPKMVMLKHQYNELTAAFDHAVYEDRTIGVRDTIKGIKNDETLLRYLARFKNGSPTCTISTTAGQWFSELYASSKSRIADFYNADELERHSSKFWTPEDITESDVEKVICCGTPIKGNGNLEKISASKLAKYFNNKRFSRQHISKILSKSLAVDRFDLITLNFFLFSQDEKYAQNNKGRYIAFIDSTNKILEECTMGELYVANPYECFLLMCILSDCPLATYADVWEISFEQHQIKG